MDIAQRHQRADDHADENMRQHAAETLADALPGADIALHQTVRRLGFQFVDIGSAGTAGPRAATACAVPMMSGHLLQEGG